MKTTKRILLLLTILTASIPILAETVSWDPSPTQDVTGYKVSWSTNYTGPFTTVSVTGLTWINTFPGRNFYYVTAVSTNGESDPTPIAFRPNKVGHPSVTKSGGAETVTWIANPAADQITGYEVHWSANITDPLPWPVATATTSLAWTNTTNGKYAYYIVAVNPYGVSVPSDTATRPSGPNNPKVVQ